MFNNVPEEMKKENRWVNWKLEKRNGKETKIPINPSTGGFASVSNPSTWTSFKKALEKANKYSGIGFVLGDGFVGVDIDNKETEVQEYRQGNKNNVIGEFIETLGSYAEYSPSGNGIHVLGKGKIPKGRNRKGDFEFYQEGRYFTVTGDIASKETQVKDFTENVKALHNKYLGKDKEISTQERITTQNTLDLSESEIIEIALKSKQGQKFGDLYAGSWEGSFNSQSEADISFCNMLAFWTGKDFNKMDTIFRNSGLYRPKWNEKRKNSTYGIDTIKKAIQDCNNIYTQKNSVPAKDTKNKAKNKANNSITINYNTEQSKQQEHKIWYEVNEKTGNIKLIPGLLADYLANSIPAIYTTGRFYLYDNGVYNICDHDEEKTIVMNHIYKRCRTMKQINDIASQWAISENVRVTPEELNRDPYILNLKNGLYYIKEKELKKHTSDIYTTIQINASYNKQAKGPVFKKFIKEVVPDDANLLLVQEMLGYSITSFNNAKKIFILDGKGDTGKSTLLNIIEDLLTEKNVSNVMLQKLSDRFNTAQLFGKTANIFADLPSTPLQGDSIFKALTGDDKVQAERKGQDPFNFYNKAKLIFSCNGLPDNYGDRSDAFYNRLIILPFNNSIPKEKQDPNLGDKLKKELDYIFMWALEGLERLINNNFIFTENEATKKLVEEYKVNSNSVLLFINEMCIVGKDNMISSTSLYNAYRKYCEDNGMKPLKVIKFNTEVVNGFPGEVIKDDSFRIPGTNKRGFEGIKLCDDNMVEINKWRA